MQSRGTTSRWLHPRHGRLFTEPKASLNPTLTRLIGTGHGLSVSLAHYGPYCILPTQRMRMLLSTAQCREIESIACCSRTPMCLQLTWCCL